MKKSFFILSLMATTAFTLNAWADDVNCYDYCTTAGNSCTTTGSGCRSKTNYAGTVYYKVSGNEMTIYGPTTEGDKINIPKEIFSSSLPSTVKNLNISGNIGTIEYHAFYRARDLTSVDLTGVENIQTAAFNEATGLVSANLTGVHTVGQSAFHSATNLTNVDLTDVQEIGRLAFYSTNYNNNLTSIDLTGITKLYTQAFQQAPNLTSIDLTGVGAIEDYVFYNDTNLTSVVFPDSFFNDNGSLKNVINKEAFIGSGVETIYCPEGKTCTGFKGKNSSQITNIISYTQDSETGVYTIGDKMYATALDLTNRVCTAGTCTDSPIECTGGLRGCQIRALIYQGDKCKTEAECGNLIDMVSNSQYACDSITTCSNYAKTNNLSLANLSVGTGGSGSNTGSGKRIYTVDEARQAVEAAGTDTVSFRIRYK